MRNKQKELDKAMKQQEFNQMQQKQEEMSNVTPLIHPIIAKQPNEATRAVHEEPLNGPQQTLNG